MDGTYGTYVDDEWFDIRDYDDDTDLFTDDDTGDFTDDDTHDGGRGNLYTIKVFWVEHVSAWKYWTGSKKKSEG